MHLLAAMNKGKAIAIIATTALIIIGALTDVFILGSEPKMKHWMIAIGHPLLLLPIALEERARKAFAFSVVILFCGDMWAIFYFGS
jgi:hypothetical protein